MPEKADNETKMVWPEHARLIEQKHKTEIIHEFLEWCNGKKIELGRWVERGGYGDDKFMPRVEKVDNLLAEFIGINLEELEREKRAMLSQMRATSE